MLGLNTEINGGHFVTAFSWKILLHPISMSGNLCHSSQIKEQFFSQFTLACTILLSVSNKYCICDFHSRLSAILPLKPLFLNSASLNSRSLWWASNAMRLEILWIWLGNSVKRRSVWSASSSSSDSTSFFIISTIDPRFIVLTGSVVAGSTVDN